MKTQMKQFLQASLVFALVNTMGLLKNSAFAQQGERTGNGGDQRVLDQRSMDYKIRATKDKIFRFFENNPELAEVFPEINIPSLLALRDQVQMSVVERVLRNTQGTEVSCINYAENRAPKVECNLAILQTIEDEKVFFALIFHELLGLLGLETDSLQEENYYISARIKNYVTRISNYDLVFHRDEVLDVNQVVGAKIVSQDGETKYWLECLHREEREIDGQLVSRCSRFMLMTEKPSGRRQPRRGILEVNISRYESRDLFLLSQEAYYLKVSGALSRLLSERNASLIRTSEHQGQLQGLNPAGEFFLDDYTPGLATTMSLLYTHKALMVFSPVTVVLDVLIVTPVKLIRQGILSIRARRSGIISPYILAMTNINRSGEEMVISRRHMRILEKRINKIIRRNIL